MKYAYFNIFAYFLYFINYMLCDWTTILPIWDQARWLNGQPAPWIVSVNPIGDKAPRFSYISLSYIVVSRPGCPVRWWTVPGWTPKTRSVHPGKGDRGIVNQYPLFWKIDRGAMVFSFLFYCLKLLFMSKNSHNKIDIRSFSNCQIADKYLLITFKI